MRVLIVDDEPRVLQGLVRSLFHLDWQIETAHSGDKALKVLEGSPVDVVISDMRMPGMDGAQLLRRVRDRYPGVVRIILSGHNEIEAAMRAVPVAHQFLSKPCEPDVVQRVIERAYTLLQLMQQEELRALVGQISELPSVPKTYVELTEVINRKSSSVSDVAAVVERDVAMSAKVLQLVNSSFFSQAQEVTCVRQAVTRLGVDMMKSLALVTHAFQANSSRDPKLQSFLEEEQEHAFKVGAAARRLCDDRRMGDLAFMGGVLHDVGKVVLRVGATRQFQQVAREVAANEGKRCHELERAVIGVSHAEVGAYLVGLWGLPFAAVEAVAHHHCPERLGAIDGMAPALAVHLADNFVRGTPVCETYLADNGLIASLEDYRDRVIDMAS